MTAMHALNKFLINIVDLFFFLTAPASIKANPADIKNIKPADTKIHTASVDSA
jgi:hypothetical protein